MRARHLALAAVLLISLSGCDIVMQAQQGATIDKTEVATDAAAQAAVSTAQIAVATFLVENPGTLPTVAQLADYGFTATTDAAITISGAPDDYCVQATTPAGSVFHSGSTGGVTDGSC